MAAAGQGQDPDEGLTVKATHHAVLTFINGRVVSAVQLNCSGLYEDPTLTKSIPPGVPPDLPPTITVKCEVNGGESSVFAASSMIGYATTANGAGFLGQLHEVCWEGKVADESGAVLAIVPWTCEEI